jgi:dienelactone hydrolase
MRVFVRSMMCIALVGLVGQPRCGAVNRRQITLWREEIRHALFIPDQLPALNVETYGSFSPVLGVTVDRVTYNTQYAMRVAALLYRPTSSRVKLPGIIIVPGHGGDKSSWDVYYGAILFAEAGAAVLTYDPIGEGESNDDHKSRTSEHDRRIDVPGVPQRLGGFMITDVMQGVSYLRQRRDVDPHRIGVIGDSLGSFVAVLTGAIDFRIHAILLNGGGDLDGPGGYWDSSNDVMCQSGPYKALRFLGDRAAVIYTLNARRGTTYIVNGAEDTAVDIPHHGVDFFQNLQARVVAMNGTKRNVFATYFVPRSGHRSNWLMKTAVIWLDNNLHFTQWSSREISAWPETMIRDWAAKTGVTINKRYLGDDQVGGIVTLKLDVPKLSQQQLDVLPMGEWERERKQFIYSTWAQHAIAAAQATGASNFPSNR